MSTRPSYTLFCDGFGSSCYQHVDNGEPTAKAARAFGKRHGWFRKHGVDYCHTCYVKYKRFSEEAGLKP